MFKLIKNHAVFSMSYPRSKALEIIDSNSKQINDHIVKYVVYYDMRPNDRNHWLNELSSWFERADRVSSKSGLKRKDYEATIFGWFGTTIDDALLNLEMFHDKYIRYSSNPYPEFEITPELANKLFKTYKRIKHLALPELMSKKVHSTSFWYNLIERALK